MNSTTSPTLSALFACGLLALPLAASASEAFSLQNPIQTTSAGHIDSVSTVYDSSAHLLSWQTTISSPSVKVADAFWVVLSDGPNPKGISDQLPIYYFDGTRSFDANGNATGIAPTLSAYAYNGDNGFTSYANPGVTLLSSNGGAWNSFNVLVATGDSTSHTMGFTIDTSVLDNAAAVGADYAAEGIAFNAANWEGAGFGSQVGIWFHAVTADGTPPTYDAQGSLTSFQFATQSYIDNSYQYTTMVPEPSSAFMVALAGMALTVRRSRRRTLA